MNIFNTQFILREKRWVWIDTDKGISILLVGFGHCLNVLQNHGLALNDYPLINYVSVFLYGFRMPLFFIISGVFISSSLKKKGLNGYVSYRSDTILYPLFVWGFIEISFQLLTNKYTNNGITAMNYFNLFFDARKTGHFWYLNALFYIGVIYAFFKAKLRVKPLHQLLFGFLLYFISAHIHINNLSAGSLTDICEYYIFFSIGDLISSTTLNEKNVKRFSSFKIFFPLLAIFLFLQYRFAEYNLNGGPEGIMFVEHKMPVFFLIEALVGCTISINFSFLLQKYNVLNFLRVIGFHSLYIYCMQIIVMTIARVILVNVLKTTYVPLLIFLIWPAGIFIPILFYNFCQRHNMWWLFTYKRPNEKKLNIPQEIELIPKSA
ncbi:acyltransferase [Mucilaginibacter sp.]|uniref:acyltransferase family protein n=1 Tax=Mucilaginibacter sp. TaxID=1882438 RepID=UPI0026188302|nr:acyltransferase [Mucilaginibacter sp.]MDB4925334.1 acyltransferase [Mucilaginibacter sp.]